MLACLPERCSGVGRKSRQEPVQDSPDRHEAGGPIRAENAPAALQTGLRAIRQATLSTPNRTTVGLALEPCPELLI
jgi:hypothetical protein